MVQDIVVHVGLDTKITPRESLVPLILTLEGEKSYKEYTSLDALLADYAVATAAGKAAQALYANAELSGSVPETVAVLGLATSVTNDDIADALDTLRDSHDDWYYLILAAATGAVPARSCRRPKGSRKAAGCADGHKNPGADGCTGVHLLQP